MGAPLGDASPRHAEAVDLFVGGGVVHVVVAGSHGACGGSGDSHRGRVDIVYFLLFHFICHERIKRHRRQCLRLLLVGEIGPLGILGVLLAEDLEIVLVAGSLILKSDLDVEDGR